MRFTVSSSNTFNCFVCKYVKRPLFPSQEVIATVICCSVAPLTNVSLVISGVSRLYSGDATCCFRAQWCMRLGWPHEQGRGVLTSSSILNHVFDECSNAFDPDTIQEKLCSFNCAPFKVIQNLWFGLFYYFLLSPSSLNMGQYSWNTKTHDMPMSSWFRIFVL